MTMLFCIFLSIHGGFGIVAWLIGLLCVVAFHPGIIFFGLVGTIYVSAPWWVYIVGILCVCIDLSIINTE